MTNAVANQSDHLNPSVQRRLRSSAKELVGQVFYGTLLRQMRSSSLKGAYGHGGRGEEVFAAQLDEVIAARAGRARRNNLTDAIVERYASRAEAAHALNRLKSQARAAAAPKVRAAATTGVNQP
jgi:hypothetical protein